MPVITGVRPLGKYTVGRESILLARGARAGDFVFLNGLLPARMEGGVPPSLLSDPLALANAESLWAQARALLEEGGSAVDRIVRCDQFFTHWAAVPFFHQVRRRYCGVSAPSTSLLVDGLQSPAVLMAMDVIGTAQPGPALEPVFPEQLDVPATSGFVPVMKCGAWVFVAGFMAAHGRGDLGGIAPQARVPEGHLWKGNRIQLETQYLIERKLVPALEAAGLALKDVRKATVALSQLDDLPAFNFVWRQVFGDRLPATTVIPTSKPGFAIEDARVEINLIADAQAEHHDLMPQPQHRHALGEGYPVAVRLGDFLVFSALVAVDQGGAVSAWHADGEAACPAAAFDDQMAWLLDLLEDYCSAGGARLENVVRIVHFHTDLRDFRAGCRAWQRRLPNTALPIAAVKVPRLPVPGAAVQVEVWVHAPHGLSAAGSQGGHHENR